MTHRILVLGGTHGTGRLTVAQALAQGHTVTALSRHPERLEIHHPDYRTIAGDAARADVIERALPGHDVVISTLGRGLKLSSEHLLERCMTAILPAMQRLGPRRLVFLSAFGVGDADRYASWILRLQFRTMLASLYADKAKAETMVRRSTLDWTMVDPVLLTNRPAIEPCVAAEALWAHGVPTISRATVADYLLKCIDDPATIRKRMLLGPPSKMTTA